MRSLAVLRYADRARCCSHRSHRSRLVAIAPHTPHTALNTTEHAHLWRSRRRRSRAVPFTISTASDARLCGSSLVSDFSDTRRLCRPLPSSQRIGLKLTIRQSQIFYSRYFSENLTHLNTPDGRRLSTSKSRSQTPDKMRDDRRPTTSANRSRWNSPL